MKYSFFLIIAILFIYTAAVAQRNDVDEQKEYIAQSSYKVKNYPNKFKSNKPKNIILMIGDGMGVTQVYAGFTANKGHLFLENMKTIGFSKTYSASGYITDSAAGGTALATGVKTYNGAIGIDAEGNPVKTILEYAEEKGKSTGLVATAAVNHATPAAFIAHRKDRGMYEDIAADFLKTDIDVFIGGGYKYFTERKDGRDLVEELKQKGYNVEQEMKNVAGVKSEKLAGLVASEHLPHAGERNGMLPLATKTAIDILSRNKNGFFLMVEGSQIDWGGHQNNVSYIAEEMLDFDRAIGKALDFAAKDGKTLIIVTADHETGGFSIFGGDINAGVVTGGFNTGGHTGVMVPVFAYGPGAREFMGIMENTDVAKQLISFINKK
ncbi:MAG: alkaline phosphatase [Mangrovibacterium sp.]|nr:alkaline phosphatase [Mangrovibacterium sp.]